MKRLFWNGVIFALAVCLIPAAASATDYTYKYTIYVPYNLTAIGPPGTHPPLSCGIDDKQDFVPWSAPASQNSEISITLDHTGSARGTLRFVFNTSAPYRYYHCAFVNELMNPDGSNLYPKLPQSMLRGVSGRLPDGKHYRPSNHNHMQMNRGNFSIPPPMKLR